MDVIEFLLIIAVFAAVLHWYLQNEGAKSDGLIGLLALHDDPDFAKRGKRKSYRIKDRTARKPVGMRDSRSEPHAEKTYTEQDEEARIRRRFRRQDELRYRIKDKAAPYKPEPGDRDRTD